MTPMRARQGGGMISGMRHRRSNQFWAWLTTTAVLVGLAAVTLLA